ncbi:single-stranded DNA-binding protein [Nocardia seriolae]|uniref:Single-stranded DNA-binding protein n=1 Tax=Nocardia seriolae TaxID=37332 RepID=A0A0B8NH06_9NOCA|nr:single-stranded DNA-binding protein [Nocardia seriolae]APA97080.1 Single-stranded DNA-binding protein [Nocardia seriolae]MTJ65121.1 single-stranded DNA-binding protein [Nocardia seriolae]MTJ71219.1 single-stranded DNA-binding protein [Nocardia seriolae]MTJ86955.1 single-stranded DNA-binding protein [Nocardia seriolae]MTK30950.1 single-stranded DNA-binding protein [Nocardia seriolae]
MSGETNLTIIGNLTADPTVRYMNDTGDAVVNFTVASTPRVFDQKTKQWKDGAALFMRCTQWRDAGQHVFDSLAKGDRVIVVGKLQQRDYTDRDGVKRIVFEVVADEVGTSLKYAVARPVRSKNRNGGGRPNPKAGNDSGASDDPFNEFRSNEDEVA